ncbi:MAG: ornithine cyclodeaminase family protein [Gemmatimonadetes bacterium]|nr:ornithine cyclodeaminase family protein [Gemmatimonadota bacterium]
MSRKLLAHLDAEQVHRALPWPALAEALSAAFVTPPLAPTRHAHPLDAAGTEHLLLMPAWNDRHIGLKVVTVIPGAPARGGRTVDATYLLSDRATGAPVALLDGEALTVRRTACVSAVAARALARTDATTLLMVGTGQLAPWMVRAHCALRPGLTRVRWWGRDTTRAAALAHALRADASCAHLDIDTVTSLEAGVRDADIICCATTSTTPLVEGAWLRAGAHLDLVGAFTPSMRETDDAAIARARVIVDSRDGARAEAGDLLAPIAAGVITEAHIVGELGAVLRGDIVGRETPQDITCFKSVGLALEDLAAAELAVQAPPRIAETSA